MSETLLSVAVGLGLAAAAGFRVFVPLFGLSLAALTGKVAVTDSFAWLATGPAAIALGTAMLAEVAAYYLPWFDHVLDTIATPAAVIAGILATGAVVTDLPPVVRWAIAIIGGGGAAGLFQGATVLLRVKSTATTGGVANPVVATIEWIGATIVAALAILLPVVAIAAVVWLTIRVFRGAGRLAFGRGGAGRTTDGSA